MAFVNRMRSLLGTQCDDFFAALAQPAQHAIHINTSRTEEAALRPWLSADGLSFSSYIPGLALRFQSTGAAGIGSLPAHHAGMIYSQDPAALLPLAGLNLSPDMRILDLCAAPGGKSSQLAQAVDGGSGFLLANEPIPSRAKLLVQNMERMGYRNVLVTSLPPQELAELYPEYFDLVLVDAPCSGEGMFRKYPESINAWSEENIAHCVRRGRQILNAATECLKPGGRLIYCTCTYAPEENEEQLAYLLESRGLHTTAAPEHIIKYAQSLSDGAYRLYPHLFHGEGQFAAYLSKQGNILPDPKGRLGRLPAQLRELNAAEKSFTDSLLGEASDQLNLYSFKDRIVAMPFLPKRLPAHSIMLLGVTLAVYDMRKKSYIPHHQFFSAYGELMPARLTLSPQDARIHKYLCGMELSDPSFPKGYGAVLLGAVALGGFRASGGRLKNLYPKGLRTHL